MVAATAQGVINNQDLIPNLPEGLLPDKIGSWNRDSFKRIDRSPSDPFGLVSYGWFFSNGEVPVVVSLDGPYDSWHDLGYCYGATGWELRDSRNVQLATQAGQEPMACVELNLYEESGQRSVVMFTSFDSRGLVVQPPPSHGTTLRNLVNRFRVAETKLAADGTPAKAPVFQVQMRVETEFELSPADRASLDELYDFARRRIALHMFASDSDSQQVAP